MSMLGEQYDQAAGLRKLFCSAPPRVVGIVPCNASVMPWVAREITARAQETGGLLALDEWGAYGNLADSLSVSSRFDLLQAAEGYVPVQDCLVEVCHGLQLASVSRLASSLGQDRTTNQRVLTLLKDLQRHYQEWFVVARAADAVGVSRLLSAVPMLVLVADPRPESVTIAYATLKQLSELGDLPTVNVVLTQADSREALALAANLKRVVRNQLGVELNFAKSLSQALASSAIDATQKFLDRLLLTSSSPVRRPSAWRARFLHV